MRDDFGEADFAEAADVRTAAEFDGEAVVAHADHAHDVAVFFAKECHRAFFLRGVAAHLFDDDWCVAEDLRVHHCFYLCDVCGAERLVVREVEAGAALIDERAFLLDVRAEGAAQRFVQQVGGGVVALDGGAAFAVDFCLCGFADADVALFDVANVQESIALFLCVFDAENAAGGAQGAAVANLSAGFAIERGTVKNDHAPRAGIQFGDRFAVGEDLHDLCAAAFFFVAVKGGFAADVQFLRGIEFARRFGALALFGHCRVVAVHVQRQAAFAGDVGGEIDREAVGVIQFEDGFAGDFCAAHFAQRFFQHFQPRFQRLRETLFFALYRLGNACFGFDDFRVGLAHFGNERRNQFVEKRLVLAEFVTVADSAAHDTTQDVTTPFVAGQDAINHEEDGGADVVGDDFERGLREVITASRFCRGGNQVAEDVDFVVGVDVLQHGGDALQPHAGIDGRARQWFHRAAGVALKLHEDDVPDFDEAVAVFFRRAGRAAPDVRAVIVEDFRAGAAGAGVAHRPEVVRFVLGFARFVADADDFVLR